MEEFVKFFTQAIAQTPEYPLWLYWVTLVGIVCLTQVSKLPIKHFTKKIQKESTKKRVNIVIMILPIGYGILASYLYTFAGFSFSLDAGIRWGMASIVLYEFISAIFNRIKNEEKITEKTIKEDVKEAIETANTAKSEFDELVKKYTEPKD